MIVDQTSRQKLLDRQRDNNLSKGFDNLAQSLSNSKDYGPMIEFLIKQVNELNSKLGQDPNATTKELLANFNKLQLNTEQFEQLKALVETIKEKMALFDSVKEKMESGQTIVFPKETQLSGEVSVSEVKKLPKVEVSNFPEIKIPAPAPIPKTFDINSMPPVRISNLNELAAHVEALQATTLKAVQALQTKFPASFNVGNEVKIADFNELLDGIEQLKIGFNLLVNKDSDGNSLPQDVNILNFPPTMVPQPVTTVGSRVYALQYVEVSATVAYLGEGVPNSLTSNAAWRIRKIDTSSGVVITWASGNTDFDKIWDNRLTYTYS